MALKRQRKIWMSYKFMSSCITAADYLGSYKATFSKFLGVDWYIKCNLGE